MKKRILSVFLVLVMVFTMVPVFAVNLSAVSTLQYSPYAKVDYSCPNSVQCGTIRYIAQNRESGYFSWNYWPTSSFGGYVKPEEECGTACISMALSYVGVDRTPKALLEAPNVNGYTGQMWGSQGSATSKSITKSQSAVSSAMNDYINGNGKYSPLCVYIVPFSASSAMHWVLLVGKISNNKYLALNPWHTAGTDGTFVIQINGSTATYNGTTNPINSINQWYNPNGSICTHNYNSVGVCTSTCKQEFDFLSTYKAEETGIYTVTYGTGIYLRPDKPYAEAEKSSTLIKTGTEVEVLGYVMNAFDHKWYKVSYKGMTGYTSENNITFKGYGAQVINCTMTSPAEGASVPKAAYPVIGTVTSKYPLKEIRGYVDGHEYVCLPLGSATTVDLRSSIINTLLDFASLQPGSHTLTLKAKDIYHDNLITICSRNFTTVTSGTTCSHSYSSTVTQEPTCSTDGIRTYTCSKCGASYPEAIPATGDHSYYESGRTEPGCLDMGYVTYSCYNCSDYFETEIAPIGSHSYEYWYSTDVTCETDGYDYYYCTRCGTTKYKFKNRARGHTWSIDLSGSVCSDNSVIHYSCTVCGEKYEENLSNGWTDDVNVYNSDFPHEYYSAHTEYRYRYYDEFISTDPNLEAEGWHLWDVETQWSDYGPWSRWYHEPEVEENEYNIIESATGYAYYYFECPGCHGHFAWKECLIDCGATITDSDYHWVYSLTSYDDASIYYDSFYGSQLSTNILEDNIVFPHSNGQLTVYRYASRTLDTTYYYFGATPWSDWTTTLLDSDEYNMMESRNVYSYYVELGEHDYYSSVIEDPTCVGPGTIEYVCRSCGDSYTEDYYSPGNHIYDKKVVAPTCTSDGFTVYECRYCEETYYGDYVSATGHSYVSVKIEPTCTTAGYTRFECTDCGHWYGDYIYFPLGHSYAMDGSVQPTKTATGILYIECVSCGETNEVILPVLNDENYDYTLLREPTYSSSGVARYTWKDTTYGKYSITVTIPQLIPDDEIIPGDVNCDSILNSIDSNLIKRIIAGNYIAESGSDEALAADFNKDGTVNSIDSNLVKRALAGAN